MTKIFFVEKPAHVKFCLKHHKNDVENGLILSLNPSVSYYMERNGINYRHCDQYYTEEELNNHFLNDLKQVQSLCKFIDVTVKESSPFFEKHFLKAGSISWSPLKTMMNSYSCRVYILNKIFSVEKPSSVFFFKSLSTHGNIGKDTLVPSNMISLWAEAMTFVSKHFGITANKLEVKNDLLAHESSVGKKKSIDGAKSIIKGILKPEQIANVKCVILLIREYLRNFGKKRNLPPIVFLSLFYQLQHLWDSQTLRTTFRLHYYNIITKPPNYENDDKLKKLSNILSNNSKFTSLFIVGEVNYYKLVEKNLRVFFEENLLDIKFHYLRGKRFLKNTGAKALFVSNTVDCRIRAVIVASKELNIPVVVYRHGFTHGHVSMESHLAHPVHYGDVKAADYFLVGGEGDCDYVNRQAPGETKVVAMGLLTLEKTKEKYNHDMENNMREKICDRIGIDKNEKIFMYVPTSWDGNARTGPYRSRSPELMFAIERKIVDVFLKHPKHCLIIKLYPSHHLFPESPILEYIKDKETNNIRICTDRFEQVMVAADVFIADYPATTFFEMLLTTKPILFCGYELPWPFTKGKWHPDILPMWKNRVLYKENLDEFIKMTESFVEFGQYEKPWTDTEMLEQFGLFCNDGKGDERCHDFLVEIVKRIKVG